MNAPSKTCLPSIPIPPEACGPAAGRGPTDSRDRDPGALEPLLERDQLLAQGWRQLGAEAVVVLLDELELGAPAAAVHTQQPLEARLRQAEAREIERAGGRQPADRGVHGLPGACH